MSSSWKIFFSPIRASYWLLDSFWPPEPKNVWFLLSRHDVCRLHEKFSSRRFARAIGCYIHLDLITPKTFDSYFLDRMYVGFLKNFFSPIRASYWLLDSVWLMRPKTFDSYFLDMIYLGFMKNFLLADSSELLAVRLISATWAQKRLIPTF